MILSPSDENIQKAADLLSLGEVVSFPTETVYGLGANALSAPACNKIFALKGRPASNPLIVHVHSLTQAKSLVHPACPEKTLELFSQLATFWPGPLTLVMPKAPAIPDIVTAGTNSVGIRIPQHPTALKLLYASNIPIAAPSANISNYISPTTAQHVYDNFGESVPVILDGGNTSVGIESTVLSLRDPSMPRILRPGVITKQMIEEAIGMPVYLADAAQGRGQSPGLLPLHYAPHTELRFLADTDLDSYIREKIGYIAFSEGKHLEYDFHSIMVLSHNNNLSEVAAKLYHALQEMDALGLDLIVIDQCLESGVGEAIMDRLHKAIKRYS